MGSKEVRELRKQGHSREALELARAEFERYGDDVWFLRAYTWALYDIVKKPIEDFKASGLSSTAMSSQIDPLMREFCKIGGALRQDIAFSQMLRIAGKASGAWPNFLRFARWAGVDDFDPEAGRPYVNSEGKQIDSLQMQFTRAVSRETAALAGRPNADQALLDWGTLTLEKALAAAPNDQLLNYYRSRLHLALGEDDAAIRRLAPVLKRQPRAAWTWAQLGRILEGKQPQDALTCYAHATQIAHDEQEVAKVRIRLAHLLAREGRFDEAAEQTSRALRVREANGWFTTPPDLSRLSTSDWFQRAVETQSGRPVPNVSNAALALLRELEKRTLIYAKGVVDHINAERGLSYVATGSNTGFSLSHRRFPEASALRPGALVEVGFGELEGPPLDWHPVPGGALPGLFEEVRGSLERRAGQGFAFIRSARQDVFVPPPLAAEFEPGWTGNVSCWAINRATKEGVVRWRAVTPLSRDFAATATATADPDHMAVFDAERCASQGVWGVAGHPHPP